jgi:hypothetical protein
VWIDDGRTRGFNVEIKYGASVWKLARRSWIYLHRGYPIHVSHNALPVKKKKPERLPNQATGNRENKSNYRTLEAN